MSNHNDYQAGRTGVGPASGSPDYHRGVADRKTQEQIDRQREELKRHEESMRQWDRVHGKKPKETQISHNIEMPAVVWLFGIIGILFGAGFGMTSGHHWLVGAFFGFVAGGASAGILSRFKVGRIILWIIGGAFAAGMAYEIFLK